jgi:hypothetical protein
MLKRSPVIAACALLSLVPAMSVRVQATTPPATATARPATAPAPASQPATAATSTTLPATLPAAASRPTTTAAASTLPATQKSPATQPTTESLFTTAPIIHRVPLHPAQAPYLPNALLCPLPRWLDATDDYSISQRLLAMQLKRNVARRSIVPKDLQSFRFARPIVDIADIEGAGVLDLVAGCAREYSLEDYQHFAVRKDRPLIVNWIEDFPHILLAQCNHWRIPNPDIAAVALEEPNLEPLKLAVRNEFEFHRLQEESARLEELRHSAFAANLKGGPMVPPRLPLVFTMRADLGEYSFQDHRYALKTPLVKGAAPLKGMLGATAPAFDAAVVLMANNARWEEPRLPLDEANAEKLRNENATVLIIATGTIFYPPKHVAESAESGLERTIHLAMSKVTAIAVPDKRAMYKLTAFDPTAPH